MDAPLAYRFGNHRLDPARRELLADGHALKLGGRAFDLLLALVARRGRTVSKDELLDLVWPRLVVEENNLQVQVVTLRKLLGNAAIVTVPGRGYRFTPEVHMDGPGDLPPADSAPPPPAVPGLLGREQDLAELLARLRAAPLVTLSGSGGIGKSRLAEAALAAWPGGGTWVALAPLGTPEDVAPAVARALGASTGEHAVEAIASALAEGGAGEVPHQRCDTLEEATRWAFSQAAHGDAVLLSPACASLDMFRNYAHRAEVFVDTVRELLEERGEML